MEGSSLDAIVIGAGHNGLVCAAYLARAGLSVQVLEARESVGGCAATVPALDGARVNVCNCDHGMVLGTPIVEELGLESFGLRYLEVDPLQLSIPWDGGLPWFLFRDPAHTIRSLELTYPQEVPRYRRYLRRALPAAELLAEVALEPPTPRRVLSRLLERRGRGAATVMTWSRRSAGSVVRSLFGAEAVRGPMVAVGPAVWGVPPDAPGTGLGALVFAFRHLTGLARPATGSGALPESLTRCVEAAGGRVRTSSRVREIVVGGDRTRGVVLESGETVEAPVVVAAADPREALVRWLAHPPAVAAKVVRRWRARPVREGYESKVDAVIAARPRFRALDEQILRRLGIDEPLVPTAIVAPTLDGMAAAHAAMRRGEVVERPMLWSNVPSVLDPSMRVADGDVFSLEVLFTPYTLRGGWGTLQEPERWLRAFSSIVEPGFAEGIVRWRAVTPPDYERAFGLARGFAPSFSGTPLSALAGRDRELTRYETPVRGLYLTGAGTFPGAGIWGASGRSTARVVLGRET